MTATTTPDLDAIQERLSFTTNSFVGTHEEAAGFLRDLLIFTRAQQQRIAELEAERDRLQGVLAAHGMEELVS